VTGNRNGCPIALCARPFSDVSNIFAFYHKLSSDYNAGVSKLRKIFVLTSVVLLSTIGIFGYVQENANFGQSLQTKFHARMTSLNALLNALEKRLTAAENYRDGVIYCTTRNMFYLPGSPSANANGCVGLKVANMNGTVNINQYAGGCDGRSSYTIPKDIYNKMRAGTVHTNFEKAGNRSLSFTKGEPAFRKIKKKVESGWFNDKHCKIELKYDGNRSFTTYCHGDGSKRCNQNRIKHMDWTGKKIVMD